MGCSKYGSSQDQYGLDAEAHHAEFCLAAFTTDVTTGHAVERHGPTLTDEAVAAHAVKGLEQKTQQDRSELVGVCTRFTTTQQMMECRERFLAEQQEAMSAHRARNSNIPYAYNCTLDTPIEVQVSFATWGEQDKLSMGHVETISSSVVRGVYEWDADRECWSEVTFYAKP